MIRTNTFQVVPQSDSEEVILTRVLDTSASLWNEVTYDRRQRFFAGEDIWESTEFYDRYVGVLGGPTTQTVIRRNDEAWKSFFALCNNPDESPSPPGYWGNETDGRELRTYLRNDGYDIQWSGRSRLDIRIGLDLKDEYDMGYYERLRLRARGEPQWEGKAGRMVVTYDELDETFRAFQSVTVADAKQNSNPGSASAALDIGVNSLVAATTTTGQQYLYDGTIPFESFRETTEHIAALSMKLEDGQGSSQRIRTLYRRRSRRRTHVTNALVRDLVSRLQNDDVDTLYIGDLSGGFDTSWSVIANEKVHIFWAYRQFQNRLEDMCEEQGITLEVRSEAWTSRECPDCGERDTTIRHKDTLTCECGYMAMQTSLLHDRFSRRMSVNERYFGRRHGPYDSSGTITSGVRPRTPQRNPNEMRTNPKAAITALCVDDGVPLRWEDVDSL